jgi:hypothetical protein
VRSVESALLHFVEAENGLVFVQEHVRTLGLRKTVNLRSRRGDREFPVQSPKEKEALARLAEFVLRRTKCAIAENAASVRDEK